MGIEEKGELFLFPEFLKYYFKMAKKNINYHKLNNKFNTQVVLSRGKSSTLQRRP